MIKAKFGFNPPKRQRPVSASQEPVKASIIIVKMDIKF
jgi:hypothetical protein